MIEFGFFVNCKPKGKGRPRFTKEGHAYTPKSTRDFENLIKSRAREEAICNGLLNNLIEGPVAISITAIFCPVASDKAELKRKVSDGAFVPYRKKPDADNIVKAVCDALNRVVYYDDNQIYAISCTKRYGLIPGLDIHVREFCE